MVESSLPYKSVYVQLLQLIRLPLLFGKQTNQVCINVTSLLFELLIL